MLLFLSNAISFFWANGLKNGMLVHFPSYSLHEKQVLFFNVFLLYVFLGIVFGGMFYVFQDYILPLVVQYEVPHISWVVAFMVFSTPCILVECYYLIHNQVKRLYLYATFIFSIKLILLLSSLWYYNSIKHLMIALTVWAIINLIWLTTIIFSNRSFTLNLKSVMPYLAISIPLVGHIIMGSGVDYVDGFLISSYYHEETFAIYRYGARELPFVLLIVGALTTSLIPRSVMNIDQTLHVVKEETARYMKWMFPLTIIIVLISPVLFPFIYDIQFKESAYILNIYALILISRLLLPQLIFYGKQKTRLLLLFSIGEFIINVGLSIILLQYYGYYGIAYGTVIAFTLSKIAMIVYCRWAYNYRLSDYIQVKKYMAYSLTLIVAFLISSQY